MKHEGGLNSAKNKDQCVLACIPNRGKLMLLLPTQPEHEVSALSAWERHVKLAL